MPLASVRSEHEWDDWEPPPVALLSSSACYRPRTARGTSLASSRSEDDAAVGECGRRGLGGASGSCARMRQRLNLVLPLPEGSPRRATSCPAPDPPLPSQLPPAGAADDSSPDCDPAKTDFVEFDVKIADLGNACWTVSTVALACPWRGFNKNNWIGLPNITASFVAIRGCFSCRPSEQLA